MMISAFPDSTRMKWNVAFMIRDLGEPHVLGIHGLNQVGPAEVEQSGVIGFGESLS